MKHFAWTGVIGLWLCTAVQAAAQITPVATPDTARVTAPAPTTEAEIPAPPKKWYEKLTVRGYVQVRYNRLAETNPDLKCDQCDKSWGRDGGFLIRRARIVFSGNVHERVYVYVQPDFGSSASSSGLNFGQLRDAYFDLALDKKKEFRVRLGQSKIPYGFENLQSSQNRLPLDRADPTNSGLANERDLGGFRYWAPTKIRARFSQLVALGLKGSGDYGVLGFGLFNGQTANRPEANGGQHMVARITYPFMLKNGQFFETSLQAYSGRYVMPESQITEGVTARDYYIDERAAATLVIYPQPLGFQAEYNIGHGPEYNPETNTIEDRPLEGGYAMVMYNTKLFKHTFIPFVRAQYYKGGKKHELDARRYRVHETEIGLEWQPAAAFELVAMYTISDRTFEDAEMPVNNQFGQLLRLQAQVNF